MHYPALGRLLKSNPEVPEHFRKFFWQEKLQLTPVRVEKDAQDLVCYVKSEGWREGKAVVNCTCKMTFFYVAIVNRKKKKYYGRQIWESRNLNLLAESFLCKQEKIRHLQSPMYIGYRLSTDSAFGKRGRTNLERQICSYYQRTTDNCTAQDVVKPIPLHTAEISIVPRNGASTLLGTV